MIKNLKLNINKIDLIEVIFNFTNKSSNFKPDYDYYNRGNKSAYNAVSNFSVPSFESGALKILEKVFPSEMEHDFLQGTLRPKDILDSDVKEVEVYARDKKVGNLDLDLINYIYSYIFNRTINLDLHISLQTVIDTLPKNTSSGFPEYKKKKDNLVVKNCLERVEEIRKFKVWHKCYDYMRKFPTTIFHRFTPKMELVNNVYDPKFKIRQIHGCPFFVVALEKLMYYNFVESFKQSFAKIYTVGYKKIDISKKLMSMRQYARINNKMIMCGDINGCDKSISKMHSSLYFQLASNFILKEFSELNKAMMCYHIRTPMLYKKGLIYSNGSTITGSWLTSSFTTINVLVSLYYSFYKIYGRLPNDNEIAIQGDDFLILIDKESDKHLIKKYMLEHNLRIRLDKSRVVGWFREIEFLGYLWNEQCSPDQTNIWIISHILYPEKYIKFEGPERIIYRILSIIINLKRYRMIFHSLTIHDRKLKELLRKRSEYKFKLISPSNEILNVVIPITKFYNIGWRML